MDPEVSPFFRSPLADGLSSPGPPAALVGFYRHDLNPVLAPKPKPRCDPQLLRFSLSVLPDLPFTFFRHF